LFLSVKDWHIVTREIERVVRSAIVQLRSELAVELAQRNEEIKTWINGSFMRNGVVEAKIDTLSTRLNSVCDRLARLEDQNDTKTFRGTS
jgi:hypothetical protein